MALLNFITGESDITTEAEKTMIRPVGKEYAAEYKTPCISIIVAIGNNGEIGRGGDMIWHVSEDLKRFKAITTGHTVVMGRKTWESLPKRPLPNRRNIVITRNAAYEAPGAEVCTSLEAAIDAAVADAEIFIMGGGEIYKQVLSRATRLYLTRIHASAEDADTFFPLPTEQHWMKVEESDPKVTPKGLGFHFENYIRIAAD
jgi:dihydrofolate reductase